MRVFIVAQRKWGRALKYVPVVLALFAAIAGFAAACLWRRASKVGADYSDLGTEPGTPEGSHNFHALANSLGAIRSARVDTNAAYWSAGGAILGLASAIISVWLLISN